MDLSFGIFDNGARRKEEDLYSINGRP